MSARRTMRPASWAARAVGPAALLVLVLGLAACGIKSTPRAPEGSTYPRQYPAAEGGKIVPAPSEKAKEDDVSPLGIPYDYPNRPPSR